MFDKFKNLEMVSVRQLEDVIHRVTKRNEEQTKKNRVLLIVILSVLVLGVAGALVYKFFLAPVDEYDDFYEEFEDDFDDIDFDDDDEDDDDDDDEDDE